MSRLAIFTVAAAAALLPTAAGAQLASPPDAWEDVPDTRMNMPAPRPGVSWQQPMPAPHARVGHAPVAEPAKVERKIIVRPAPVMNERHDEDMAADRAFADRGRDWDDDWRDEDPDAPAAGGFRYDDEEDADRERRDRYQDSDEDGADDSHHGGDDADYGEYGHDDGRYHHRSHYGHGYGYGTVTITDTTVTPAPTLVETIHYVEETAPRRKWKAKKRHKLIKCPC